MSRPLGSHGRSTARWRRIRAYVLQRDARVCWVCGHPGADTVDHLVPLSRGGDPYDPSNLRAAHNRCNARRGNRGATTPLDPTSEHW